METTIKVYSTTDYDSIKTHPLQRPASVRHVMRLKDEIAKSNRLLQNPALINEEGYLVDGQHRLEAARILGVPFYYTIGEATIDEVRADNTYTMKWSMEDYVHSFANQGEPNYMWFRDFVNSRAWLNYSTATLIIKGSRSNMTYMAIKAGRIGLTQDVKNRASTILGFIDDLALFNEAAVCSRSFIAAFSRIVKTGEYDHLRMMGKLDYQSRKLVKCVNRTQAAEMIQEIYNHKTGKHQRVNWLD